jgi:hypothetical protein
VLLVVAIHNIEYFSIKGYCASIERGLQAASSLCRRSFGELSAQRSMGVQVDKFSELQSGVDAFRASVLAFQGAESGDISIILRRTSRFPWRSLLPLWHIRCSAFLAELLASFLV